MSIYERVVEKRVWVAIAIAILTAGLGFFAIKVKPDHSIELLFPTHDVSRVNYERYRKDFPLEGVDTGAAIYPEEWPEGGGPTANDPNRQVVS